MSIEQDKRKAAEIADHISADIFQGESIDIVLNVLVELLAYAIANAPTEMQGSMYQDVMKRLSAMVWTETEGKLQ